MNEQLLYEIDGIKYLLFTVPIMTKTQSRKLTAGVKKYEGMIQGATVKQHWWNDNIVYTNVLIPEKNAKAFNDDENV